jgi:Uma2 family endonuclease
MGMSTVLRWTTADVDALPDTGSRYEIIDGELFVSKARHWHHQATVNNIAVALSNWCRPLNAGLVLAGPGIVYADDEAVIPDLVWISKARMPALLGEDGKLADSPDLVIEVLSFGTANEQRDREAKRRLYSRRGVREYWIADWRTEQVAVYSRQEAELRHVQTLLRGEQLTSALLPGFACVIDGFFQL